jgi:hypothetical protein
MIVAVFVKPHSKKGPLVVQGDDGAYIVYVRQPAEDGQANQAVAKLLADHFLVSAQAVHLKSGVASRRKLYVIDVS